MEKELKPFDKILVRNSNKGYWIPALYGFKSKDMKHHLTSTGWQDECIPYEGNEEYLGTNKDYICRNFPEIVESEDKKIRKQIKMFIISHSRNESNNIIDSWIAWLEKQGEQKLAEWSEEDENIREAIVKRIRGESDALSTSLSSAICWLMNIKGRVQPKQEWSEEDDKIIKNLLSELTNLSVRNLIEQKTEKKYANWLKSLRPQNTWKPSEEQMEALEHFVRSIGESGYASPYDNNTKLLYSLLSDLKKLKG